MNQLTVVFTKPLKAHVILVIDISFDMMIARMGYFTFMEEDC